MDRENRNGEGWGRGLPKFALILETCFVAMLNDFSLNTLLVSASASNSDPKPTTIEGQIIINYQNKLKCGNKKNNIIK
jgi:hypothetical protein